MKANELMIGDWVINPVHKDARKIEGVYYDKELHCLVATDGRFPQEHFEPIPLTAEILEKNGFCYCKPFYYNEEWDITLEVHKGCNGYYTYILGKLIHINYVHELQHALRLCELTYLADNLKV